MYVSRSRGVIADKPYAYMDTHKLLKRSIVINPHYAQSFTQNKVAKKVVSYSRTQAKIT